LRTLHLGVQLTDITDKSIHLIFETQLLSPKDLELGLSALMSVGDAEQVKRDNAGGQ